MPHETTTREIKVQKRNGQVVAFNEIRIKKAIGNAFKEHMNLPREVELPIEANHSVDKIFACVGSVLKERFESRDHLSVEEIQDEVIRQLYENGFKDVGELYANYRKLHASKRALFNLYSTTKRDGKVVSFKPEKITYAIVKGFRASNGGLLTEDLLEIAREISANVIEEIRKTWPQGKCIHIEEIQDLVETNLMKAGYHEVARKYIIYREKRARERRASKKHPSAESAYEWTKQLNYKTKTGEEKPLNLEEIRYRIENCCQGIKNVSASRILKEAVKNYFNGISEEQIRQANIMAAKALIETEPQYSYVSARLLLLKAYREAIGKEVTFDSIRMEYPTYFAQYIHTAVEHELLAPDMLKFDLNYLGRHLISKRDFTIRYLGLQTLYDRYFIHLQGRRLELPQIFWMRVAMGLAKNEGAQKNERAIEFYNMLSQFRFVSSTPTLFNSGTRRSQL
ncbi:MAG: hypothetical protein KC618_07460, partial [Candidatus Omnitrophica bacterium]|nr:hypothetical protein [Candidatus Omnitrophota bacterium]